MSTYDPEYPEDLRGFDLDEDGEIIFCPVCQEPSFDCTCYEECAGGCGYSNMDCHCAEIDADLEWWDNDPYRP